MSSIINNLTRAEFVLNRSKILKKSDLELVNPRRRTGRQYDVIVFAGEDYDLIKNGKVDPTSPWARWFTPLPTEYEGGLDKDGVDNLKAFVQNGSKFREGRGEWLGRELNPRRKDFQSFALPAELPSHG